MVSPELTVSDFLRNSGEVLDRLDREDLVLRRRDGEDVFLARADRQRDEREAASSAGRLLARLLEDPVLRDRVLADLPDTSPWTRFLPESDVARFADELVQTIAACAELGSFAPVGTLVRQWKNTAEVWAQPRLLDALTAKPFAGEVVQRPDLPASDER